MTDKPLRVELFTIPQAACNSEKANWDQAAAMVKNQLENRFGSSMEFQHIVFMSEQWFVNQKAQEILNKGEVNFPFVLVDGEIASADKKINISKINKTILSIINNM